ncbi:MAG TPA: cyclopropane-fatty-acyl-phospholipid synthase family protein [Caulobacteraceae bacterium]|nr:cyclopropane-fatty-acyl-phospholipid synthase family protein [Caulobacteraceae bacterium]
MGLKGYLASLMREGRLTVRIGGGRAFTVGSGEPALTVSVADYRTAARIGANPALALGEAWMDGKVQVVDGSIYDLLDLVGRNLRRQKRPRLGPVRKIISDIFQQWNARRQARRNVAHHYDLSVELYRRFLDEDLQYSCAYFADEAMTLEQAQAAKKRHIAAKMLIRPGDRVLDIGCGWGGMGLTLAEEYGAEVTGVTLSTEQLAMARQRAQRKGLEGRARFELTDYRDVAGPFDRIVSVGMFEHVGRPNYQTYFDTVARLLTDDGVAVIHSIGRSDGPSLTQPWIARYIFPGGYIPALSEVLPAVERAGLIVTDVEILRLHYAETLRHWRDRFEARRAEIAELYDERFCRMWDFYLAASEIAFRHRDHMVFQLQLARKIDAVPLTRDYIGPAESAPRAKARHVA